MQTQTIQPIGKRSNSRLPLSGNWIAILKVTHTRVSIVTKKREKNE